MNFNDALVEATRLSKAHLANLKEHVFLVRDLHGRIRILLKKRRDLNSPYHPHVEALIASVSGALGPYSYAATDLVMYRDELRNLSLPDDTNAVVLDTDGTYKVCLHDRLLMGAEWSSTPPAGTPPTKRFTLFSMKGGVGRSTTAAVLAHHLAKKGSRVLVLDLDLESPGIGATLLGARLPAMGIVDWFVEDALGEGDKVLPAMVAESGLQDSTSGRIAVVPAFGTDTQDYLAKLGRAYLERGPQGPEPWPARLRRLVQKLEAQETPNIVLLDSRTGLHDTSAALVLAMGANTLLFAVDTEQTWRTYRYLFEHWTKHPNVGDFYNKLWMVGAQTTFFNTAQHVSDLLDSSWKLFSETLYNSPSVQGAPGYVAPIRDDAAANHYPRLVYWQPGLLAFDPIQKWSDQFVHGAYYGFLDWFDRVLLGQGGTP